MRIRPSSLQGCLGIQSTQVMWTAQYYSKMGYRGHCYKSCGPYITEARAVTVQHKVKHISVGCPVWGHQNADHVVLSHTHTGLVCEAVEMRIRTSKSEW